MRHYAATYGFQVEEISAQDIEESIVSSTKIRTALLAGEVHLAHQYLGSPYILEGKVEEGLQRGTTIGFPTANVRVNSRYKLIPKNGVYAVWVFVAEKKYVGMLNIGHNPTFADKKWSVEVNILDFDKNIYHKNIKLAFVTRVRDEQKFESSSALVNQLQKDEASVREILGS